MALMRAVQMMKMKIVCAVTDVGLRIDRDRRDVMNTGIVWVIKSDLAHVPFDRWMRRMRSKYGRSALPLRNHVRRSNSSIQFSSRLAWLRHHWKFFVLVQSEHVSEQSGMRAGSRFSR